MHVGCSDYFRLGRCYPRGSLRERYHRRPRPWVQPGTLPTPPTFPVPCPYRPGPGPTPEPARPGRGEAPDCSPRRGSAQVTDTPHGRPDVCC